MSPSTEVGLFAPPIVAVIVFVLTWNIERATSSTGTVSRERRNLYTSVCLLLMFIGYAMLWWHEIEAAWAANPLLITMAVGGIVVCIVYLGLKSRRSGIAPALDDDEAVSTTVARKTNPRSPARRIFAWIIIVWGIGGLVGGIAAIIRSTLSR